MTERQDEGRDEDLLRDEESAAAAEAGAIGGPKPEYTWDADEPADEAHRAAAEGGDGVAEGFEQAEADLVEEASHGDGRRSPEVDAFSPEAESDEAGAVYAEPDEIDPTEVVSDPREDEDDPGSGPGLAADR